MALRFNRIAETAAGGRRGRLDLPHQTVETPVFMPVGTQGTVKAVPQDTLESLGAEIILCNTYHLYLRPGHEAIRRMGGLHKFISWPHALLTDSGGFQVFSLNELRKVSDDGVRFRNRDELRRQRRRLGEAGAAKSGRQQQRQDQNRK